MINIENPDLKPCKFCKSLPTETKLFGYIIYQCQNPICLSVREREKNKEARATATKDWNKEQERD